MGHKKVCFNCRKGFSIYGNKCKDINLKCSECGGVLFIFNHKFRPPKKEQVKEWELVEFLKDNGFTYQYIFEAVENGGYKEVSYPLNMNDAKEFVKIYKSQAYTDNNIF